jgi:DNA-binding MarR family transcriptional regulator
MGVTASMCAVMASLATGEARSVPELARQRGVSRQHIQTVINALIQAGLARAARNPSHRRSPLLALTDEGLQRLRAVEAREAEHLVRMAPAISHQELAATTSLFDHLERDLAVQLAQKKRN